MKRLALVLAAAVLGSGCIASEPAPCAPYVTVDWSFLDADGNVLTSCGAAGVTYVDVYANGTQVGSFDCAGPARPVSLARGANDVIVEGVDAGGAVLFRELRTVDATTCGSQGTLAAQPAEGWLAVDYSFSPTNSCDLSQTTYMWIAVRDDLIPAPQANVTYDEGTTSAQVCSTTAAAPRYRLPVGNFTFLGINEVRAGAVHVAADCTDRPFDIGAAAVTTVSPVLVDSASACF